MRNDLLPGVTTTDVPPTIACDARAAIRSARRRAIARDVLQLTLLAAVDYLFLRFDSAHIPTLDRAESLNVMRALNGAVIGYLWLERAVPRWIAKRVATTWCRKEQARFFAD